MQEKDGWISNTTGFIDGCGEVCWSGVDGIRTGGCSKSTAGLISSTAVGEG